MAANPVVQEPTLYLQNDKGQFQDSVNLPYLQKFNLPMSLNDTSTEHFKTFKHLFHAKLGTAIALSVKLLCYGLGDLRFDHQQKQKMISIPKMSRVALGSIPPPIQLISSNTPSHELYRIILRESNDKT